jgi:Nickel responsive protein SCO4226-like
MPKFTIRRDLPAATDIEIDAAALRAIACVAEMKGRVKWIRSYWDRDAEHVLCVYEAANEAEIREHARIARIPCDEVREVSEFGPDEYVDEIVPDIVAAAR